MWVVPKQQLAGLSKDMDPNEWLSSFLSTMAKALNDVSHMHAKSGFAQRLVECAKHRTSPVRHLNSRVEIPKADIRSSRKNVKTRKGGRFFIPGS